MNWTLAISRNREALRHIVAALFALAGLAKGGSLSTLPRHVFHSILLVLRPAESAVRRLILIAAHGLILKPQAPRAFVILWHRPEDPDSTGPRARARTKAFKLFDPLKAFDLEAVRDIDEPTFVQVEGSYDPSFGFHEVPPSLAPINACDIGYRLNALMRALDNLPHQARRLARWQHRRDLALAQNRPTRLSPIRPGPPPGKRQRSMHEVDDVLKECHGLALDRLNEPPDTT
ncbi:MAG: hypothetical protein WCC66_08220 [Rhizobiaceae bacterium]